MSGVQTWRFFIELIPAMRPNIATENGRPMVFHSADLSPVTDANPAAAGEVLTIRAKGLGPVRPVLEPGQPFPKDPTAVVNSPLDVRVNGQSGEVISAIGWPGSFDEYRVDFRLPSGLSAGEATLRLAAAWIPGREVRIAVR